MIAPIARQALPSEPASPARPQLGSDVFLKLLVAQMRTQNPLEPQKGTEFVSQLAQLNTVEQLVAIRAELAAMRQQAAPVRAAAASPAARNPQS